MSLSSSFSNVYNLYSLTRWRIHENIYIAIEGLILSLDVLFSCMHAEVNNLLTNVI